MFRSGLTVSSTHYLLQQTYEFLVSLEDHLLSELRDGVTLGSVYDSIVTKAKAERPEIVEKLTRNFGFSMGIEFRDAALSIAAGNSAVARAGAIFTAELTCMFCKAVLSRKA